MWWLLIVEHWLVWKGLTFDSIMLIEGFLLLLCSDFTAEADSIVFMNLNRRAP